VTITSGSSNKIVWKLFFFFVVIIIVMLREIERGNEAGSSRAFECFYILCIVQHQNRYWIEH
jgi:hypothetical protein